MSSQIKVCVDRVLPIHLQYEATKLALEEHSGNAPTGAQLGDALERLTAIREWYHPDEAHNVHRESLVLLTSKKWAPGRRIRIFFMDGPEWAKDKAMMFFKRWEDSTSLTLVRTSKRLESDWRVTFESGGSWSYLGTDTLVIPKDQPTMQLGWLLANPDDDVEWRRVCVHEGAHGIDFGHEQASPAGDISWDKPVVYDYYAGPPNYWSAAQVDRQVFFKYSQTITNFSAYDPLSIMHYAIPVQFVTDPADAVGWNTHRSEMDRRWSNIWYPEPDAPWGSEG